ncbi:DNA repair protein RAD52 homolog isoform X2 [Cataglyphis hispanica]|nr:DNA repair protein RAD52 homolog isoform X2 [Cataglyphis hispanica]
MDFAADCRDLILTANKVFGEGKWNHTVVHQTLDYVEIIGAKCSVGCVSSVKVQLENGNFHEEIGYYSAEESTKGLSIHNARIGSAVNGLRRALLSFGNKIERELQSQKEINPEQTDDIQKSLVQSSVNKQIEEKSNVHIEESICKIDTNLESDKNKVPIKKITNDDNTSSPSSRMVNSQELLLSLLDQKKIVTVQNDKADTKIEEKSKQVLSAKELQRMERKRKQMEKQMEFKKRMMEKEGLAVLNSDNKPNPKY